jgi:3',5'-cyclic AMP phosphodiesterase CpdA
MKNHFEMVRTSVWRYGMLAIIVASAAMNIGSCKLSGGSDSGSSAATSATFAVMSDLHYYDPSLGTTGTAFEAYLDSDRKMIAQSKELLTSAVANIATNKPNFVLVTGDLTKDGEKANHQQVAAMLKTLKDAGIKVYVIPGNHDICNQSSYSYSGATTTKIDNIAPADFKTIYKDCGYSEALAQDPNSLSYVVEPVNGLWLFAIDSCEYTATSSATAGTISTASLAWITSELATAKQKGKTVIGMMHHGILEHFTGQSTLFPEYVITNWATLSQTLSDAGMNVVFTGHFHANDVVYKDFTSSVLYDIETGSLVTAPSPYRYVKLDLTKGTMNITTSHITSIPSHASDFVSFSQNYLYDGLNTYLVPGMLTQMGLSAATATALSPLVSYAMMAHYYGDESGVTNPSSASQVTVSGYPLASYAGGIYSGLNDANDPGSKLRGLINNVWVDTKPSDNNLTFTLNTTTYTSN